MKTKMITSLLAGITLSAVTLYLAFRNVPFNDLVAYLRAINYVWIIPAGLIVVISFFLRAWRWQIILASNHRVMFWPAYHPMMIGFMINCILPGRVGEVARPAILKRQERVPFTTGLATVAAERIFDIILLILLFAVVLASVQVSPELDIAFDRYNLNRSTLETIAGGMINLSIILVAGIFLVSVEKSRSWINRAIMALPRFLFFLGKAWQAKIEQSVAARMVNLVNNVASGFMMLKHPAKMLACSGLTVLIWGLSALSWYVFALGCPGLNLSVLEITAVMVIVCFFIALPSVPGFWGLWEAGGVFAMTLFGISLNDAAGFTLANHAIQMFPVIIMGFISALITGINVWRVSYEERS
jgi:uncharacterized protein (TIRG00374 family)